MTDASILITGGCGFIGSHLIDRLLADNQSVVCLDNLNDFYNPEIKKRNQRPHLLSENYTFIEGDIRDEKTVSALFVNHDIELVIHFAAMAGVRPSVENPGLYMDVNVMGTQVLLEAAKDYDVKHFVFASASSVYGNNEKVPFSEDDRVDGQISPYGSSKRMGELLCQTYHHLTGLPVTCLRFFTVYGPRQRPEMAIHSFVRSIINGEGISVFGDGTSSRDYTYIDDIINGIIKAAESPDNFVIYNLGNSEPVKLIDMVHVIGDATGKNPDITMSEMPVGDVIQTFADISRSQRKLGYDPKTNFEKGIKLFVEWFRSGAESKGYQST